MIRVILVLEINILLLVAPKAHLQKSLFLEQGDNKLIPPCAQHVESFQSLLDKNASYIQTKMLS